jgi:hypothetical protein
MEFMLQMFVYYEKSVGIVCFSLCFAFNAALAQRTTFLQKCMFSKRLVPGVNKQTACRPDAVLGNLIAQVRQSSDMFNTRWFKYDRDDVCVNKSQFVPVIFEPPCNSAPVHSIEKKYCSRKNKCFNISELVYGLR